MIPIGGMLLGTGLGVIAEIATQGVHAKALTSGQRIAISAGFGLLAGLSIAYALNSNQEDAKAKGELAK